MPSPPRAASGELAERIREVLERAAVLAGLRPEPGVRRFRSIEEAQEARLEATRRRIRARGATEKAPVAP